MRQLTVLLFILLVTSLQAELRNVTVLHTSDIHTHLNPDQAARLTTIINRETANAGGRNKVLLIDTGDLIQGTFAGAVTRGRLGIEFINANNYQVWIPGNHDLEFGLATLIANRRLFTGDTLAANLNFPGSDQLFFAWKMYEINRVKVAVIGLTFPFRQQLSPPNSQAFRLEAFRPTLERIMPQIMAAKPDIIILAVHYGFTLSFESGDNSLFSVIAAFPQINAVLGGHTHQIVPGRRLGSSSWYEEPGKHGEGVMSDVIVWDSELHQVQQIKTRFYPSATVKNPVPCPETIAVTAKQTRAPGLMPVGELHCKQRSDGNTLFTSLHHLFGMAAVTAANADVAFISPSRLPDKFPDGKLNAYDLFQLAPYEDELIVLPLTAAEIKVILQEQLLLSRKNNKSHLFQAPWGFNAEYNHTTDEIGKIVFPRQQERYQTVFSGFILARADRRQPQLQRIFQQHVDQRRHTGITIRDALGKYLKAHSPLSVEAQATLKEK